MDQNQTPNLPPSPTPPVPPPPSPPAQPLQPATREYPIGTALATEPAVSSHRKRYVIGIVVFIVVALAAVAMFMMLRGVNSTDLKSALPVQVQPEEPTLTPTPTPTPTSSAEPTPAIELNKTTWKFEILNGSGVVGAAANAKAQLTEEGYSVTKVGNADTQDHTQTELFVVDSDNPQVDLLVDDLQKIFPGLTISDDTLPAAADSNARIILGVE